MATNTRKVFQEENKLHISPSQSPHNPSRGRSSVIYPIEVWLDAAWKSRSKRGRKTTRGRTRNLMILHGTREGRKRPSGISTLLGPAAASYSLRSISAGGGSTAPHPTAEASLSSNASLSPSQNAVFW